MSKKQTIAVYIPKWLYRNDKGITIFVRGLHAAIKRSGKYRLLKITPRMCMFGSQEEAKAFVERHNIVLVIYHDSRVFPNNSALEKGLDHLEACVPFLNPKTVHVADDKFETKRILREAGIPVLSDVSVTDRAGLWSAMEEGKLYVAKPHNAESGNGVKLIKRSNEEFFQYQDGAWHNVSVRDGKRGLVFFGRLGVRTFAVVGIFMLTLILFILHFSSGVVGLMLCAGDLALISEFKKMTDLRFVYHPLMLEPFFGDTTDEFYCLRCTVIGGVVVESAKKANTKNVTPNISHGGKASKVALSGEQLAMAVAASQLMGAAYAGIDLLCAEGKTVVCEVNVGPIGVYCEQTGVDVGGQLAEYAMKECDERSQKV